MTILDRFKERFNLNKRKLEENGKEIEYAVDQVIKEENPGKLRQLLRQIRALSFRFEDLGKKKADIEEENWFSRRKAIWLKNREDRAAQMKRRRSDNAAQSSNRKLRPTPNLREHSWSLWLV